MSKELDYLDDILKNEPMTLNKRMIIEIIKEKIQRLESIDNAKPSEALKDLKELHELAYGNDKTSWKIDEIRMSSHIKQALIKAQEQEKVLSIIKEKRVDMETLENAIFREKAKQVKSGLQWYNNQVKFHSNKQLTQEDFELLMRWLG